jgi:hypothetical protein
MTQPTFVPIVEADQVRSAYRLDVPSIWTQSRPSELRTTRPPRGRMFGTPGPDQGYALKLARRFEEELVLEAGESAEDAIAGCTAVAMRRAAGWGRAPVTHDLAFAFTIWGFLDGAPAPLRAARAPLFRSASHHYTAQRDIASAVTPEALVLSPEAVAARLDEWADLLVLPAQD